MTESEKERLREDARREFPDDEMMQEIHYVRLLHHHVKEKLSRKESIQFYKDLGTEHAPY
ncbi:hypothetical protein KA005_02360 [bacterium]|nr:hypothetical protein [bacterium]